MINPTMKRTLSLLGYSWVSAFSLQAGEDTSLSDYDDNCLYYSSPQWQNPFYISPEELEASLYASLEKTERLRFTEALQTIETLKEVGNKNFIDIRENEIRKITGQQESPQFFAKFFTVYGLKLLKTQDEKIYEKAYSYFIKSSRQNIKEALYMVSQMREKALGTSRDHLGSWVIYQKLLNNGFFQNFPREKEF